MWFWLSMYVSGHDLYREFALSIQAISPRHSRSNRPGLDSLRKIVLGSLPRRMELYSRPFSNLPVSLTAAPSRPVPIDV